MGYEFICDICQRKRPAHRLAECAAIKAGGNLREAIKRLPPEELVCQDCLDIMDELVDDCGGRSGDVPGLQWYLDFDDVDVPDQRRLDWLRQNY